MAGRDTFLWPFFYQYPPFFTLQPIKETRDKQSALWCSLILSYCKYHRVYVLGTSQDLPLFNNKDISRKLSSEAIQAFLNDLTTQGNAKWLDPQKKQCLILWKKIDEWAQVIADWAHSYGVHDTVMLLDELSSGDDVTGTELEGLHREVLIQALKLLEDKGKVKLFKGATPEEEGVKFL
eukprot:jgi/Chrzof1/2130/Cz11g03200.t1